MQKIKIKAIVSNGISELEICEIWKPTFFWKTIIKLSHTTITNKELLAIVTDN
jgi:hypothetical protein